MGNEQRRRVFWQIMERFKTVAELIVALLVISPIVFAFIQRGLSAPVPAWLVLIISLFAVLLGCLLGRRPYFSDTTTRNHPIGTLIEKVDFNYSDSPLNHGWNIWESTDETQPELRHILDGYVGTALEIRSNVRYAMDYFVNPPTSLGHSIEFVVRLESEAQIMALVIVQSQTSQTRDVWLDFVIGSAPAKRIDDGSWYEWMVYIMPERRSGNWLLFRVNLQDAVQRSAGNEGWEFSGPLKKLRLRGNLSLAYISVYE